MKKGKHTEEQIIGARSSRWSRPDGEGNGYVRLPPRRPASMRTLCGPVGPVQVGFLDSSGAAISEPAYSRVHFARVTPHQRAVARKRRSRQSVLYGGIPGLRRYRSSFGALVPQRFVSPARNPQPMQKDRQLARDCNGCTSLRILPTTFRQA
jgi:hypothetical protein